MKYIAASVCCLRPGVDGVVPLMMERITSEFDGFHLGIGDLYTFRINSCVEFAFDIEAGGGCRCGDRLDGGQAGLSAADDASSGRYGGRDDIRSCWRTPDGPSSKASPPAWHGSWKPMAAGALDHPGWPAPPAGTDRRRRRSSNFSRIASYRRPIPSSSNIGHSPKTQHHVVDTPPSTTPLGSTS